MSYNNNVPLTGQTLGNTRAPIHDNFFIIDRAFTLNHYAFSSTQEGKHKIIQLPEQSTFPLTPANEGWLLARDYNGITELAWRPENTAAVGDQYILTGMPLRAAGNFDITAGAGNKAAIGLAFNILSVSRLATVLTVTFAVALPTNTYFVIHQYAPSTQVLSVGPLLTTGFTITGLGVGGLSNGTFQFLVFGG